jgi:hypothetical protein
MANQGSRIVDYVACLLHCYVRFFTIYGWHRYFYPPPPVPQPRGRFDRWVDGYVLVWFAAAAILYVITRCPPIPDWLHLVVCGLTIFSILRVIEIPAFHLAMLLSGTGYGGGLSTVASHRRSLLLFLVNYLEIVVWFAVYYSLLTSTGAFQVAKPQSFSILRESLAMMVANTTGAFELPKIGEPAPAAVRWTLVLFIAHNIIGLFLTVVMVARVVAYIPVPLEDTREDDT